MIKFPKLVGHREKAWWLDGSLDSVMNAAAETSCSSVGSQSALQTTMIFGCEITRGSTASFANRNSVLKSRPSSTKQNYRHCAT
jgi:hypothetical protein